MVRNKSQLPKDTCSEWQIFSEVALKSLSFFKQKQSDISEEVITKQTFNNIENIMTEDEKEIKYLSLYNIHQCCKRKTPKKVVW